MLFCEPSLTRSGEGEQKEKTRSVPYSSESHAQCQLAGACVHSVLEVSGQPGSIEIDGLPAYLFWWESGGFGMRAESVLSQSVVTP